MTESRPISIWRTKEQKLEWCENVKAIVDKLPDITIRFPFEMFTTPFSSSGKEYNDMDTTIELIEKFVI